MTDRIGLGVLTRLVTQELVAAVIAETGRQEKRVKTLPARVVVNFVLALSLFYDDSYEEVMRKLVQGMRGNRVWKRDWKFPTTSALTQARQRLGVEPMREIFERVAVPCSMRSTEGAWKRGRRLMSIDGFEMDAPDTAKNAEYFGYSGVKKKEKSAFPKVPMVALAECGTHAIVEVEIGTQADGEHSLAARLATSPVLGTGMLVMTDRGLYSYGLLDALTETGADVCMRVPSTLGLPVLKWLNDKSFLSYIAEPEAKKSAAGKLKSGKISITDLPGHYVRVVDYEVPGRGVKNEIFALVTNVLDPDDLSSVDLAEAYHERWEIEITYDEVKTRQRGPGVVLRSRSPEMVIQELYGLFTTHYGIRKFMMEAADQAELDPDRMSFTRSLNIIRRQVTSQAAFSPSGSSRGDT